MIISRTPFRISLFGGGSDYPSWYEKYGGTVIGFAIDRYCYISLRELPPFFEHRHRIVYSRVEQTLSIEEIQHPAIRNVLLDQGIDFGVEIHYDGDLPARSGLGSSSAFTIGLLNCLHAHQGRRISKLQLAKEAIRIEQKVIKENVGSQDQIWAAYGGMNRIDFRQDGMFDVTPVIMNVNRLDEFLGSLMLFFTGLSRYADAVAQKKIANLHARQQQIFRMTEMVDACLKIFDDSSRSLDEVGRLLHESWQLKRSLADVVSTPAIDEIYQNAREAGAIGGKLLGAGGGGFILFYVPPNRQAAVREKLRGLIEVDFGIDNGGSKIVVYEPQEFRVRSS